MTGTVCFMHDDQRAGSVPAGVDALLTELSHRYRDALAAVLLYGSCRRKADAYDGLVDLLVLVSSYRAAHGLGGAALANAMLPPSVYYLEADSDSGRVRCKFAVISVTAFARRCGGGIDGYFWARFTQPARLVWTRDEHTADRIAAARAAAAHTFARRAAPLFAGPVGPTEFWQRALTESYRCELRPEAPGAAATLVALEPSYWTRLSGLVLPRIRGVAPAGDVFMHDHGSLRRTGARLFWVARRVCGKALNVARLFKAAGTFTNGIDYLLWKAERHSGVRVEATARMRQHPRRSAWRLAWQLWRRGAFR
jgi:hypothetical protein